MLEKYTVLRAADLEDTRTFLTAKGLAVRPGRRAKPRNGDAHARISGLYAERFYIGYMAYGGDLEIDAPAERGDFGFSAPLRGAMAATDGAGEFVACTPQRTLLASPGAPQTTFVSSGSARFSLSLKAEALRAHLAVLTGEPVAGDVVFGAELDLTAGPGRLILDGMTLIARLQDSGVDALADPRRAAHFEDMALNALLLYQPHSHSGWLDGSPAAPAPRDVRRAVDFIEANLDAPLRLADIVAASGAPGRTLSEHFRAFTGLAPLAYVKRARLRAARDRLVSGAAESVTAAALSAGFTHLGRFSVAYRTAYGETPSETLARSRRR